MSSGRLSPSIVYRQQAARLPSMAESHTFGLVRDGLPDVTQQDARMAAQAE